MTGKLNQSINNYVISTVGSGSRMKTLNPKLHKSLLPIKDVPILHHLIEQIPENAQIYILVGYLKDQVSDYLAIAFPKLRIKLIHVEDWESENSGTGFSLKHIEGLNLESFWYSPCDLYLEQNPFTIKDLKENTFFYSDQPHKFSEVYTWFTSEDSRILKISVKLPSKVPIQAFTGVMFIKDAGEFLSRISSAQLREFVDAIQPGEKLMVLKGWNDTGNPESYLSIRNKFEKFDFSKEGEFTFQLKEMIIKWWDNPKASEQKLRKVFASPAVYPKNVSQKGNFLSYELATGDSYYKLVNPDNFLQLLQFLKDELWTRDATNIFSDVQEFYVEKTNARITSMNPDLHERRFNPVKVNGISVRPWNEYLSSVDWPSLLSQAKTSRIHGDLQFDNIIYDETNSEFILIDWRATFGLQEILGDIHYDFAKMLGGLRLNYLQVKRNEFKFSFAEETFAASLVIPRAASAADLENLLHVFVVENGYSWVLVQSLVPIIYWNMAPMHSEPFKSFLWSLGLLEFSKLETYKI